MRRYSSLRWKLIGLAAAGGIVAAVIAAAGFSWLDLNRSRQSANAQLAAIGDIVADQAAPAITLGDRKAAAEILQSLRAGSLMRGAALYDVHGNCFAAMEGTGNSGCARLSVDGLHREGSALVLTQPVTADSERIGTLVLAAAVPSGIEILRQYLSGAALILVLSLAVAALVALSLQSRVSAPILAIARFAERITETHCYADRITVESRDEVGVLAGSLNAMLEEIERRDLELAQHRQSLEEEVAERSRVNSELRLAKERAEDAARLKSEFLANMSHEIRTPMNGVMGMLALVLDRCSDPEQREQLEVAQKSAQSLVTILNDILDLSKLEAGKMTIEAIDFDLRAGFSESLRMFDISVRDKDLELKLHFDPDCPSWVRGDPVRLRQVLVNLVGNAVKFTAKGSVHVSVAPAREGVVRFEVRDTGIGIPVTKLQSIFEPFTQADGSHTRQFGGTGLGLTITRRLVDLMGGALWADSEPGRGSCFSVELPFITRPAPAQTEVAPVQTPDISNLQILVAEDNPINQTVISSMLRRQGATVTMAANGVEACEQSRREAFDLILMDIQMPEMDGLEATARIREDERASGAHVPIIAVTAHASPAQQQHCLSRGMDAVITKPVNLTALLQCIAGFVCPASAG